MLAPMPVPTPGMTIPLPHGESFAVGRVLGTGGMGTVVEATHAPSGRRVALKFLHDELLDHPTIPARFAREVELATSLTTDHVARTFGLERTPAGVPFMIMELLEGRDLAALLRSHGPLPPARAARLIAQACEALEEAHARGIVHRDLKPENLFVTTAADGSDWVKVLDFGISKLVEDGEKRQPQLTRVGTTVGTPEYMAPEQLRGARDLDGSADVYSLGCVLFELLSGRRPFAAPNYQELVRLVCTTEPPSLSQLRGDLPASFVDVVARAMARDRRARIPTARALREALAPWIAPRRRAEETVMMEPAPSSLVPSIPSAPRLSQSGGRSSGDASSGRVESATTVETATTLADDHESQREPSGPRLWPILAIGFVILIVAVVALLLLVPHGGLAH
jgi:serine/threonine-protein kinase